MAMQTEEKTITLFRPIGSAELALIAASGFTEFPSRLPGQPFFYPVCNEVYATQIARDWNTKEEDGLGFVTRFDVRASYLARYETHIVGSRINEEYWIPAEELDELNRNIVGTIEVIARYTAEDRESAQSGRIVNV
jgi:hypothetical protein